MFVVYKLLAYNILSCTPDELRFLNYIYMHIYKNLSAISVAIIMLSGNTLNIFYLILVDVIFW